MKKHMLLALSLIIVLTLSGCGNKNSENSLPTTNGVDITNSAVTENPVIGKDTTNPMKKITDAKLIKTYSHGLNLPDNAAEVTYYLYNNDLFEIRFKKIGVQFTARTMISDSPKDISGMYYNWTIEDDLNLNGFKGSTKRYIGDEETVDVANWYDKKNGINYSLSAVAADLDGFDIIATVEQMCVN